MKPTLTHLGLKILGTPLAMFDVTYWLEGNYNKTPSAYSDTVEPP